MSAIVAGSQLIVDGLLWVVVSVVDGRVTARRALSTGTEDTLCTAEDAVSDMGNGLFCLPGRVDVPKASGASVVAEPAAIVTG